MEFVITSKLIKNKQKFGNIVFFDKIGKISICIVVLLPGIFVFMCIIDYKTVMNIGIYIITIMLTVSFVSRITNTIRYMRKILKAPARRPGRRFARGFCLA
jgi:hypothetical protein